MVHAVDITSQKKKNRQRVASNFPVLLGCDHSECHKYFSPEIREKLNATWWAKNSVQQSHFISTHVKKIKVQRRRQRSTDGTPRNYMVSYDFSIGGTENGTHHRVCKVFFYETLGYSRKNNSLLKHFLDNVDDVTGSPGQEKRGTTRDNSQILQREKAMVDHLKKFPSHPSYYRRAHAPLRKYLPKELTVTFLLEDFKIDYPEYSSVSYETYRTWFSTQNISFAKLGHEECERCRAYDIHKQTCNLAPDSEIKCEQCIAYNKHKDRYVKARALYQSHASLATAEPTVSFYSVDLEKVIMLPRMDQYKECIFTKRL